MKNTVVKVLAATALTGLSLLNSGCEQESDRLMASAQACMDSATTAAQANACAAKVEGIETPSAYLIRCSANFIAQGFTGERIADAYQRMTESGGGSGADPMMSMISYLVFNEADTANSVAKTLSNCTKSGTISMVRLSEVANLATSVTSIGGITYADLDPSLKTPAQLETAVKNAISNLFTADDPDDQLAIGTIALQMNASVCTTGSSLADKEVCTYMEQAIQQAGGTSQADLVGKKLIELLRAKF